MFPVMGRRDRVVIQPPMQRPIRIRLRQSQKGNVLSDTEFDQLYGHDDAFFLPAHGLFADWEAGVGCVRLSDDFASASSLTQIKVLGDWKREMADQQAAAFVTLFRHVAPAVSSLDVSEQIAHFKRICEGEGVECPDEVVRLLYDSAA